MKRNLIVAAALLLGACTVPNDYAPTAGKEQVKAEQDAYLTCMKQYGYDNPVFGEWNSGTYKGHEIDDCMAALGWTDINPKRWE